MAGSTKAPSTSHRGLLFGLLAAPVAWAALHMFDYLWIETACRTGLLTSVWAGISGVSWVVVGATLVALAFTLWAGLLSYGRWRRLREPADADQLEPIEARSHFLAASGLMVSVLFAVLIVLTGLPVLFLSPCVGAP